MGRILSLILVVSFTGPVIATAQSADDNLLTKGTQLYHDQQFEAAIDVYERALSTHGPTGPLLYNIGNTYFQMGHLGEAIRYYEKAALRLPGHPKVQHNLSAARQTIDQPIPSMPAPFWQRWWNDLINLLGPRGLFLIGLGTYLPAMGLVAYRMWRRSVSRLVQRTMWVLLTVALLGVSSGLFASWQKSTHQRAVIISAEANLHREPAANSTVDRTIPEGTVVYVNEDLPEWQNVRLPNGATGWAKASRLGNI